MTKSDSFDCHDLAKQLSHYLYLFYFIFLVRLTTQGRSTGKYHMIDVTHHSHMSGCHSVTSHDGVT